MSILSRKMFQAGVNGCASHAAATYEDAVRALNGLQSNAAYLKTRINKHDSTTYEKLSNTRKYLERCGISLDQLDRLSVIHIAGSKGKGSACAFTESLLRSHGVRTGLYTSPHLVSVRERLRINGEPIDEEKFTIYFFKVYKALEKSREYDEDMPSYFKFLTVLMFNLFLSSPIDVAIIEVGIGGEHDCTNIVQNPTCVGITSLALEHTALLGNTLEAIAFQKSGIFKIGCPAFSLSQPEEAAKKLEERAREKNCTLSFVSPIDNYPWSDGKPPILGIAGDFQSLNASLAIRLASTWLQLNQNKSKIVFSLDSAATALSSCKWPGRTQLLRGRSVDFYLDGAHTFESIKSCASWFKETTKNSKGKKILVFNTTGDRDSLRFLGILRTLGFERAFFVPNIAGEKSTVDQMSYIVSDEQQMLRCQKHCYIWGDGAVKADNVSKALEVITREKNFKNERINLLVTGSLHLVGAVLAILDPNLTMTTKF